MTRPDDQPTMRPERPPPGGQEAAFVFSPTTRLAGSAAIVVVGVLAAALSGLADDDRDGYVLAHALTAAPFVAGAIVWARGARRACPRHYRGFWDRWLVANVIGTGATLAAIGSVVLDAPVLLLLDMALLVAAAPVWASAGLLMLRAQAGRRDATVDVIDATMALLVLTAPGVLLLAEPLADTPEPLLAGPFALFLVLVPAGLYGGCLNVARVPRGERLTQGLGVALSGAFAVSTALQLAHVVAGLDLPLPVFVGALALNLGLVTALPLWSHRVVSGGLGRLPVEHQVRRAHPMPTVSAVVLPVLAAYVLVVHERPWAVAYLMVVLLAVTVLNALRHSRLSAEARSLSSDLARMAEERRQLLASMVRALDDDRRRAVSELHTQTVGSLSTLGTVVQTACVSLPAATASVVREAIAQLQDDLSGRAEELRLLMMAMRPPRLDDHAPGGNGDDVLSAALAAYAADLQDEAASSPRADVQIAVDPALDLDRSTMTIVCRIAQEALLNAVRHARATTIAVQVGPDGQTGGIVVEVRDDGSGFDPLAVVEGSGLATLRLFTDLGRGELTVRSTPGEGTVVLSRLGVRTEAHRSAVGDHAVVPPADADAEPVAGAHRRRRHLRLIPSVDGTPGRG